jgi:hypothetical protein
MLGTAWNTNTTQSNHRFDPHIPPTRAYNMKGNMSNLQNLSWMGSLFADKGSRQTLVEITDNSENKDDKYATMHSTETSN